MTITVALDRRGYDLGRLLSRELNWKVLRYSNHALGGPYQAEIRVTGPDAALWELMEILRDKVWIRDHKGEEVWWGYVAEVEVTALNPYSESKSKVRVGASTDTMYNRVAIAWEDIAVGTYAGPRYTTDWEQDNFSVSEFGIKEGLFSGTSATDVTLVEQAQDTLLSQKKYPIPKIELNVTGESYATIRCRGWWDTLNWQYCSIPTLLALSYETTSSQFGVGRVGYEQLAQQVQITGGAINLATLSIYAKKVGLPSDDITVSIYTSVANNPGILVQSGSSISSIGITTSYTWISSTFSPEVTLTNGAKYFIVLSRTGAMDSTNYIDAGIDSAGGYAGGRAVYYTGTTWTALTSDVAFRLYDNDIILTSTQALNIITKYGQFFRVKDSEVNSGVLSESYRDGDGTAHFEVEELLQHGTVRGRRMLSKVTSDRRCTIYEEDADDLSNYYSIMADGKMKDQFGSEVRRTLAKCGVYAMMVDVIPPSVDASTFGNATKGFIEINEYDAENDINIYTRRDELNPFVVGRPLDG